MNTRDAHDMQLNLFQLVGRITELALDGKTIQAAARVPRSHAIFQGHFPGHPLMPGVLIGEFMAQTSGFLLLSRNCFSRMPFLAAIKQLNLRSFVAPGTELVCDATLVHAGSGYAVLDSEVKRAGEAGPVADARLTFRVIAFPKPDLEKHMRNRASEVGLVLDEGAVRLQAGKSA